MGTNLLPSVDSDTKQLDDDIRARIALNLGDPAMPEGAALSTLLATLGGSQAPAAAARAGNRTVFLGDSIMQGADQVSTNFRGTAWPIIASVRSAGRITHVRNAGIGGNTTLAMLNRFDADVTPYAPTTVVLLAGTNDSAVTPFDTWAAQMASIISKIRGIGATPIMATIPPNNGTSARKQSIIKQNLWIRDFANRRGIALVDFYALLVDPASGNFKAAYMNDGIHPSAAGYAAMGVLFADTIAPTMPAYQPTLTADDGDVFNLVSGGCFTAASGTALPSGWTDNAGTPGGSAVSYVTDSGVPGQMLRVTNTASSGLRQIARTIYSGVTTLSAAASAGDTTITLPIRADFRGVLWIGSGATAEVVRIQSSAGGGPQTETLAAPLLYAHAAGEQVIANAAPGDELLFSGRVSSDGGVGVTAAIKATGGTAADSTPMGALVAPFTRGAWSQRFTVPAGTTSLLVGLQNTAGTGVVDWGQVGVYNLTRMGISWPL
jgi:lysophospholipase L1-like esterase